MVMFALKRNEVCDYVDIGDLCAWCGRDTAPGSALWVNRIPAWTDSENMSEWFNGWESLPQYVEGWLCRECLAEGED
jgi:hypothetical protein